VNVSGIPLGGATVTVWCVGSNAHVPPPQLKPPYTVTSADADVNATAAPAVL
jgi:hypothetical protein